MAWVRAVLTVSALSLALGACGKKEAAKAPAPGVAAAPSAHNLAAGPPHRRPGLWEQRVSMGDFVQVSRICLDSAMEQKVSLWGAQATRDVCEENHMTRRPDGAWSFSSACNMGSGGKTLTTGTATGDFKSSYEIAAESSTTGASAPQMNGTRKMVMDAAWKGPCPADLKPGDMELPGGMKINLLDLSAPKAAAQP